MMNQVQVQYVTVDDNYEGQRIDNFLMARLKTVPKSRIYQMIRKGEVRINKGRVKVYTRLKNDDVVRIPPVQIKVSDDGYSIPNSKILSQLNNNVIFEDKKLLVLNKPSGLAVHGGSGVNHGLIESLRYSRSDDTLELVHRLDRETSGVLLIAKRKSVLRQLHVLLEKDEFKKPILPSSKDRSSSLNKKSQYR